MSSYNLDNVSQNIKENYVNEFEFEVPILVIKQKDIIRIAESIPTNWQNNKDQKSDVAYLFPEINSEDTIEKLPLNIEHIDVRYKNGAIFWNVKRENLSKSKLTKLASHKFYKLMTVRNVNTARFLATWNIQ